MGTRSFWRSSDSPPEFTQGDRRILRDIFGGGSSSPPPAPDYGPMAAASDKGAQLGYDLGQQQLAETQRQYDRNMTVAQPVIDAQLDTMRQTRAQGQDYYDYMVKNQRPVENELNRQALAPDLAGQTASRDRIAGLVDSNAAMDEQQRGLITGGDAGVYNARRGDIDWGVGNAVADARRGQSQNANMMMRQGLRYCYSPSRLAAMAGQMATSNASQQAASANAARTTGIAGARQQMGQDYSMRNQTAANRIAGLTNNRNMGLQDQSTNWGRQLDVAGLYRNLPGASQGAYGLATNAGNAAVANSMQPSNQMLTGMAQGAGMQQQGVGQQLTGLGGVLSAQGSYNNMLAGMQNANAQADAAGMAGLGSMAGTLGAGFMKTGMGAAMFASDRRLKENIEVVGVDEGTSLPVYEFNYRASPGVRYRGVMADDVEKQFPDAVVYNATGFAMVNYDKLGIQMVRV